MPSIDNHTRRNSSSLTLKLPQDFSKPRNQNFAKADEITTAPPVCPLFTTKNTELVVKPIFVTKNLNGATAIQESTAFRPRSVSFPVTTTTTFSTSTSNFKKFSEDNSCCRKKLGVGF